jgi:hypothetical protein
MYSQQDYLKHYGIIGMHWGTSRGQRKLTKITKQTNKIVKRANKGRRIESNDIREQGMKVRKLVYKNNKRTRKIKKYLGSDRIVDKIFGLNRSKEQIRKAKEFLNKSEIQSKKLSEVRSEIDRLKMDLLI